MNNKVAVSNYLIGSSAAIDFNGIRKIVTPVRYPGEAAALAATDSVTAVVRRNGVIIG